MLNEYIGLLHEISALDSERKALDSELRKLESEFRACAEACAKSENIISPSGRRCYVLHCKKVDYDDRNMDWNLRWDDVNQRLNDIIRNVQHHGHETFSSDSGDELPF